MSTLVEHAQAELDRLNLEDDQEFKNCILKAVEAFAEYGHSGGSAPAGIFMLNDLLLFRNLSPLTDDPNEWQDRSEESGIPLWQSIRNYEAFSTDGGKTHYLLSEKDENPENTNEYVIKESEHVDGA